MGHEDHEDAHFDLATLRAKAAAVLSALPSNATTERFTYLRRHFWVTRDFARGAQITQCLCAKCVMLGPIA